MRKHLEPTSSPLGLLSPALGSRTLALVVPLALGFGSIGCGSDEKTRILPPVQVAMDKSIEPVYNLEDLVLYEVKRGVSFPIVAPDAEAMASLEGKSVDPYGRQPWITLDDVRVQLSWTLSNLDTESHAVELLVDPWNEFGRYYPGLTLVDAEEGEFVPNLSGIDNYYVLEGVGKGEKSRRHGTYTYEDLDELARDFGTVMNLILHPPNSLPGGQPLEDGESPLPTYVNHAFDFQNHSERDALIKPWVPGVVAGLTGVDVGIRSHEQATIALEVVIEITDSGSDKVRKEGGKDALLPATTEIVTIGTM